MAFPGTGNTGVFSTAFAKRLSIHRRGGPKHACARGSLGKEERDVGSIEETFRRNPVGHRAHPVESGQQPEASLASWQATARAKRRQRVSEPAHSAPK